MPKDTTISDTPATCIKRHRTYLAEYTALIWIEALSKEVEAFLYCIPLVSQHSCGRWSCIASRTRLRRCHRRGQFETRLCRPADCRHRQESTSKQCTCEEDAIQPMPLFHS